jgi:predicted peroxiredoxin
MVKLVIDMAHAPFGHENAYAGFFVAMGWVSIGNDVFVVLRGDGAYAARKGQGDSMKEIGLPPTEKLVMDILGEGAKVFVEHQALDARGILTDQLIEGVKVAERNEIDHILLEHGERILTF